VIDVRPLSPDDREPWERLFRAYLRFYERNEPQALYDRAWSEFIRDERMHALVGCLEGRIVGIAHYLFHVNTSSPDVCYLQDLFTARDARRRGVARALIAAVAERARAKQCARLYWMTQESNTVARGLYDRVAEYRGFIRYQMQLVPRRGARASVVAGEIHDEERR
jgi:ribosomal protein S18 acetylase RimI-like enzyme